MSDVKAVNNSAATAASVDVVKKAPPPPPVPPTSAVLTGAELQDAINNGQIGQIQPDGNYLAGVNFGNTADGIQAAIEIDPPTIGPGYFNRDIAAATATNTTTVTWTDSNGNEQTSSIVPGNTLELVFENGQWVLPDPMGTLPNVSTSGDSSLGPLETFASKELAKIEKANTNYDAKIDSRENVGKNALANINGDVDTTNIDEDVIYETETQV